MTRSIRRALLLLLVALPIAMTIAVAIPMAIPVLISNAEAQADPRIEARARYAAGRQKYESGDYRSAIVEFSAAEELVSAPVNDFNIALSYDRLGELAPATKFYRRYLDRLPNALNRGDVEASLKRIEGQLMAAEAEAAQLAADEKARAVEAERLAEEARQEQLRADEEARRAAGPSGAPGSATGAPAGYPATGDPELDQVAAVDLAQIRAGAAMPPPSAATGGGPTAGAPANEPAAPPVKKSKAFYQSPVFWVVAAVCTYVVIVLASDSSTETQPGGIRFMPRLDRPGALTGGGATLLRF